MPAPAKSPAKKSNAAVGIVIGVAVLLAAGAAVIGYQIVNKGASSIVPSIPGVTGPSLNPNCELNDPELCKFMNNYANVKTYTVVSTAYKNGTVEGESTFQLDGADKFRMLLSQGGKESYETITISDTTYTKDYSDNKWFKYTSSKDDTEKADDFKFDPKGDAEKPDAPKTTYKAHGKEACGDRQCFKYEVIDPSDTGTQQFMWFDDKEYKLRRTTTVVAKDGTRSEERYDYGKVTIKTPSPVKEGPATPALPGGTPVPIPDTTDPGPTEPGDY